MPKKNFNNNQGLNSIFFIQNKIKNAARNKAKHGRKCPDDIELAKEYGEEGAKLFKQFYEEQAKQFTPEVIAGNRAYQRGWMAGRNGFSLNPEEQLQSKLRSVQRLRKDGYSETAIHKFYEGYRLGNAAAKESSAEESVAAAMLINFSRRPLSDMTNINSRYTFFAKTYSQNDLLPSSVSDKMEWDFGLNG